MFFQKNSIRKAFNSNLNKQALSNSSSFVDPRYGSTTSDISSSSVPKASSSPISWISLTSSQCFNDKNSKSSGIPTFNSNSALRPPILPIKSSPKGCCCSSTKSSSKSSSSSCPILPPPRSKGSCLPPEPNNPYDVISGKNPGPVDSDGSKACIQDNLSTNALGAIGPLNFALTRPPYKIETCDQVIIIEGETFQDPRDYSVKVKAIFTLSVYMINMLGDSNANTLKAHMLISDVNTVPQQVIGAPNCLEFFDQKSLNRIVMCFKTKTQFMQIKHSFSRLMQCRAGGDLKKYTEDQLNVIIRAACFGKELEIDKKDAIMRLLTPITSEIEQIKAKEKNDSLGFNDRKILGEWAEKYGVNVAYGARVPGQLR